MGPTGHWLCDGVAWVSSDVRSDQCTRQTAIGLAEISILRTETNVRIGEYEFEKVQRVAREGHLPRRGRLAR